MPVRGADASASAGGEAGASRRSGVRIVLVEPQYGGNIGQCARAMINTGLARLVLVSPREHLTEEAFYMARDGRHIVDSAQVCETLEEALQDVTLAIGTTRRVGKYRRPAITPREMCARLGPLLAGNEVAIVFGREDKGLFSEHLDLCQWIVSIPASDEFPSFNLAQAVLICAHELFLATEEGAAFPPPPRLAGPDRLEKFYDHLRKTLTEIHFLVGDQAPAIFRTLRRIFGRADLEPRDLKILHGVLAQMQWFREGGVHRRERLTWAGPGDRDEIAQLLQAGELPWAGLDFAVHRTLILRDGAGKALGCVAVEPHAEAALLRSLAVAPDARLKGIGQRLTIEAIAEARRLGASSVWLLTTGAAEFFARAGFEAVERTDAPESLHASAQWGACCASATLMRLPLAGSGGKRADPAGHDADGKKPGDVPRSEDLAPGAPENHQHDRD